MIRVLIAEDEPPTMRRLLRMIEQADPEFSVAATALDGAKALEKMAEAPCDVVFTDIRMPVMDGLELMNALRAQYPETIIVVVSGYQDFAYVSHAVRLQSLDYILKPISKEALEELLGRIKDAVHRRDHARLSRDISKQISHARPAPPEEERKKNQLAVCLFCAGALPMMDNAEMFPGAAAWNDVSPEKILQESSFEGFSWEFMGNTPVERMLIFEAEGLVAEDIARAVHAEALRRMDIPLNCACFSERVEVGGVGKALRRMRKALPQYIHIGESGFFVIDGAEAAPEEEDGAWSERLAEHILHAPLYDAEELLDAFMRAYAEEKWSQSRLLSMLLDAVNLLHARRVSAQEIRQYRDFLMEVGCTALSMGDIRQGIHDIIEYHNPLPQESRRRNNAVAAEIREYIEANYAEHINNKTLAAAFGYVPSYISQLFRKEYGVSPSDYLTRVRLENAKRLFHENPDMLVREIAESVGFKSQHHFTRIFKKNEGRTPTDYHIP